jgi:hypothetical protein
MTLRSVIQRRQMWTAFWNGELHNQLMCSTISGDDQEMISDDFASTRAQKGVKLIKELHPEGWSIQTDDHPVWNNALFARVVFHTGCRG